MKRLSLLFLAMVASFALQAQWTNDPSTNNLIGNHQSTVITSGEILTVTDVETNDTYFHWGVFKNENGYIATFQRLTADGTPQWGPDGISLTQFHYINHSDGRAIDITPDHDLLACFSTVDTTTVAMRFHPDGTYAWGEQGILLFDGKGHRMFWFVNGNGAKHKHQSCHHAVCDRAFPQRHRPNGAS